MRSLGAVVFSVLFVIAGHSPEARAQSAEAHVAAARAVAYRPGHDFTWVFKQNCTQVVPPKSPPRDTPNLSAKVPPRSEWYTEPAKVFDNLYYVGTQLQSM